MSKGLFITFEGGEGAGKTTQIRAVTEWLNGKGVEVVPTREPGGTPEAEKLRDLLVRRDGGNWTAEAEVLLFFAARHMHITDVIKPALQEGKVVICDRFTDSTRAYQAYGHGQELEFINKVNDLVLQDFKPDITFILDLPAKDGLARSERRQSEIGSDDSDSEDRFEKLDVTFHEKLRQGFLEIARREPERCVIIDALQTPSSITKEIKVLIDKKMGGNNG
ncbi:MAG: dTMP kinase [Alphaproteobacteria bacterium]|nr:dTMP kinase [Alphaproteobacteria bacterium]